MFRSIGSRCSAKSAGLFNKIEMLLQQRDARVLFVCAFPDALKQSYVAQGYEYVDRIKWCSFAEYDDMQVSDWYVFIDELEYYLKERNVYGYSLTWDNEESPDILDSTSYTEDRQLSEV